MFLIESGIFTQKMRKIVTAVFEKILENSKFGPELRLGLPEILASPPILFGNKWTERPPSANPAQAAAAGQLERHWKKFRMIAVLRVHCSFFGILGFLIGIYWNGFKTKKNYNTERWLECQWHHVWQATIPYSSVKEFPSGKCIVPLWIPNQWRSCNDRSAFEDVIWVTFWMTKNFFDDLFLTSVNIKMNFKAWKFKRYIQADFYPLARGEGRSQNESLRPESFKKIYRASIKDCKKKGPKVFNQNSKNFFVYNLRLI